MGPVWIVDQVRKFPPLKANGPVSRILFFWVYCPKKGQEIRVSEHLSVQSNSNFERRRDHRDKRQIITASTSNKRPHDDRDGPGGWRRGGEDAATGGRRRVDPVISAMQAVAGVRCGAGVRRGRAARVHERDAARACGA